jgi:ABC-type phosphate transport system substrate-binding protein
MRTGLTSLAVSVGFCFLFPGTAGAAADNDLAVVTSSTSYLLTLTSNDLRALFLGERSRWPNGSKVVVAVLSSDHPEFAATLKAICRMSESEYKSYVLQAEFAGKDLGKPQEMTSPDALKKFVSHTPGAIGFVRASDVDPSVRMLRIDGAFPGGGEYKLHLAK